MSSLSFLRISNHLEYLCTGPFPLRLLAPVSFRVVYEDVYFSYVDVYVVYWLQASLLPLRLNRGRPYATWLMFFFLNLRGYCDRKITLAMMGRIDVRSGNKNPPFCIKSLFLADCLTRLSASRRSANLYFCSLRLRHLDSGTFPTNTFKTHSFILSINSLPPAEIIAFLNFGFALLSTCRVW